MSEWWSYRLGDFLLFSPRTYWRLVESYNRELWPAHLLAAIVALFLLFSISRRWSQPAAILLALCWAMIAWQWELVRYAEINWAARWLAGAFVLEACLLLMYAFRAGSSEPPRAARWAAWTALLAAFAAYPAIALLAGRSWLSAEIFALHADPTAIVTAAVVIVFYGRRSWPLLIVPIVSALVSGATLLAMEERFAWIPPVALLLTIGCLSVFSKRGS
jgi:hypothetical protein